MNLRRRTAAVATCIAFILLIAHAAAADPSPRPNLLLNGNFVVGAGNAPDHWRTEAWISSSGATAYKWIPPAGGKPGEVSVDNLEANDARWVQTLTLRPGWYYFSVEARAGDVAPDHSGVSISVLEDGITSSDLQATTDWRQLGFYLKVGGRGADVEVALRVGGFSSLNKGAGYFRNASVVAVEAPPSNASPAFDLESIRRAALPTPVGRPWSLAATFVALAGVAILGWWLYSGQTIAPAPIDSRAQRRRRNRRKVR